MMMMIDIPEFPDIRKLLAADPSVAPQLAKIMGPSFPVYDEPQFFGDPRFPDDPYYIDPAHERAIEEQERLERADSDGGACGNDGHGRAADLPRPATEEVDRQRHPSVDTPAQSLATYRIMLTSDAWTYTTHQPKRDGLANAIEMALCECEDGGWPWNAQRLTIDVEVVK